MGADVPIGSGFWWLGTGVPIGSGLWVSQSIGQGAGVVISVGLGSTGQGACAETLGPVVWGSTGQGACATTSGSVREVSRNVTMGATRWSKGDLEVASNAAREDTRLGGIAGGFLVRTACDSKSDIDGSKSEALGAVSLGGIAGGSILTQTIGEVSHGGRAGDSLGGECETLGVVSLGGIAGGSIVGWSGSLT